MLRHRSNVLEDKLAILHRNKSTTECNLWGDERTPDDTSISSFIESIKGNQVSHLNNCGSGLPGERSKWTCLLETIAVYHSTAHTTYSNTLNHDVPKVIPFRFSNENKKNKITWLHLSVTGQRERDNSQRTKLSKSKAITGQ